MLLNKPLFLKYATKNKLFTPLKSFSDSLLFYYIGTLALENDGDLLEIGCGGSTYVLYELSEKFDRTITVCDVQDHFIDTHLPAFPSAKLNPIVDSSINLNDYKLGETIYSHVDGDKNYNITKKDLEFCINNMAEYGIICQDDYGNNKWPSITQAVLSLVTENKLKIIIVGDSSIWLTKPEYYGYWMNLLSTDREFEILKTYIGMQESSIVLECSPNYYFINTLNYAPAWSQQINQNYEYIKSLCTEDELKILNEIHEYSDHPYYLRMPYPGQSIPGHWLS
jgi:hypothetical protein